MWLAIVLCVAAVTIFMQLQQRSNAAASAASSEMGSGGTSFQNPVDVTQISLTTSQKTKLSFKDFEGKIVLAFFGYTNCPDVCPITLLDLADMYESWGEPEDVQILMVTVDPARDTPEKLQQYVENFHESFLGLSGTNEEIGAATQAFFIGYAEQNDGLFLHTDVVFVIDREGQLRKLYGQQDIEFLAAEFAGFQANQW